MDWRAIVRSLVSQWTKTRLSVCEAVMHNLIEPGGFNTLFTKTGRQTLSVRCFSGVKMPNIVDDCLCAGLSGPCLT